MHVDRETGLLEGAIQRRSPNCDARPPAVDIDCVIIHNISLPPGEFNQPWIDALFHNRLDPQAHPYFRDIAHLRVSSHLLIRRDGAVYQYVPFHLRAWHAGQSCLGERQACNDFSIGIELEGADEIPYTEPQYQSLLSSLQALRCAFPAIERDRIVGHSDVAPGRKTDPGPAFDWSRVDACCSVNSRRA